MAYVYLVGQRSLPKDSNGSQIITNNQPLSSGVEQLPKFLLGDHVVHGIQLFDDFPILVWGLSLLAFDYNNLMP